MPAYGGGHFLADKSAWARAAHPALIQDWAQALQNGQLATCSVTALELLYSARSAEEFEELEEELTELRVIRTTQGVLDAAVMALRELSRRADGYHRVAPPDAIVAAAAADAGIGVLHYDHDFDRLAEVLEFESRWIAPAGSID